MEALFPRIWALARQIPPGKVATYGQLARWAGNPRLARAAGYAMHSAPADVPCHRVVNREGRLAPAFAFGGTDAQRQLLEAEGIAVSEDGYVDMKRYQWDGKTEEVRRFKKGEAPQETAQKEE